MDRKADSDANDKSDSFHISDGPGHPDDGRESVQNPELAQDGFNRVMHPRLTGTLCGFRDGLGLAMELADEFAFISAGVLLDSAGNITDLITTQGIGRPIGPLVGRICATLDGSETSLAASGSPGTGPVAATAVVLLTVRPFDADVIREADLNLFRRVRWAIGVAGAELLDWIETDGDLFRSYAYVTCPVLAWPDDPPGERLDQAWSG